MGLAVSFSGQIGSGKSSVTRLLADQMGWKRTAFGEYLRGEVGRRGGDPDNRKSLQDLGQSLVEADTDGFCREVLSFGGYQPGDDLLIDGVRHVSVYRALRRLVTPAVSHLVYLSAPDELRSERVSSRPGGLEDLKRASGHLVEADLQQSLPAIADARFDASEELHLLVTRCRDAIGTWKKQSA